MSASIAESLVRTCLRVKEDEVVTIGTWQHTIDLATAIALECEKAGALPLITLDTDDLFYGKLMELPEEQLKKSPTQFLSLLDVATVSIYIIGPENPIKMRKIPPGRFSAMFEGEKPVMDRFAEGKIRSAFIMLGYVTPDRAKTYKFSYLGWKKAMNAALAVDYREMLEVGRRIRDLLEKTREVHITSKEGTDLRFEITGRPIHIYDGVVDEEDLERGSFSISLPAGSVSTPPVETSAEGRVVFDLPIPQVGKVVRRLEWTFENGRITEFKAKRNLGAIKPLWEGGHGDKDRVGSFSLGINPQVRPGYLMNSMVLGAASISIGDNRELGGKNDSDYFFEGTLSKPTVELDGKTFVKNGKYVA